MHAGWRMQTHSLMPLTHMHMHRPSGKPGKCQKARSGPWLAENLLANWKIDKYLWENMKAAGHGRFTGYNIFEFSVQWNQIESGKGVINDSVTAIKYTSRKWLRWPRWKPTVTWTVWRWRHFTRAHVSVWKEHRGQVKCSSASSQAEKEASDTVRLISSSCLFS